MQTNRNRETTGSSTWYGQLYRLRSCFRNLIKELIQSITEGSVLYQTAKIMHAIMYPGAKIASVPKRTHNRVWNAYRVVYYTLALWIYDNRRPVEHRWHHALMHCAAMGLISLRAYRLGNWLEHKIPHATRAKAFLTGKY